MSLLRRSFFLWILLTSDAGVFLWGASEGGALQLAPFWGDNMVLQSGRPIHIWGRGAVGASVQVSLGKQVKKVRVKSDSTWVAVLSKMAPSNQEYTLEIASKGDVIRYKNVLIGDVWVCIGQYNMIFPMKEESHFMEEYATATAVNTIRFFSPSNITLPYGLKKEYSEDVKNQLEKGVFYNGKWEMLDKNSFENISALAYYFARRIHTSVQVPLGIINLAVEGSPIESWISEVTFTSKRKLAKKIRGNWMTNPDIPSWARKIGANNLTGMEKSPSNPKHTAHPFKPCFLYNVGIEALKKLSFKGILMYQGETNSDTQKRTQEYSTMLTLLIQSYRKLYKNDKLPFFWVQLPSINNKEYINANFWAEFRHQQLSVMKSIKKNAGLVPSYDVLGENAVPNDKKEVANRLSALVLLLVYRKKPDLYPPAAVPVSASYEKKKGGVLVRFNNVGGGLEAFGDSELHGFSINGSTDTRASILSNRSILVTAAKKPKFVYYAWSANASKANLVNSAKVPALAFKIKVK